MNPQSELYGFKGGPSGLIDNDYIQLTRETINRYLNTGGFDLIGSGRTKLEKKDQFDKVAENCSKLGYFYNSWFSIFDYCILRAFAS